MSAIETALRVLRPPPDLGYNGWAEKYRVVPVGTSPEPGPWRSRPWQRAVFDALDDPTCEGVLFLAASQRGGKTECVLCVIGRHVHHDPAPILIVEPTVEMAQALSKDRLAPMIEQTPVLRERVAEKKSRDSDNTILHKGFLGGHLTLVGANSPSGLAMRPIRVAVFDEIDRYPASAGSEGDPLKIAERRTVAFWNRKKLWVTSPGTRGISRSELIWMRSDQQEFGVSCPDCGEWQVLRWDQVQWERDADGRHLPETAGYVCKHCGVVWDDATRWRASAAGECRAQAPYSGIHAIRMNALAVPGQKLSELVAEWLEAQGKPELLKVFVNTVLCDWWEEKYHSVSEDGLRREAYPMRGDRRLAPRGVAVLTAGVDVQDDRLEVAIDGWGRGEEWWRIEHRVLHGDPSSNALWIALWDLLCRPIDMDRGGVDWIRATGLDTGGHHTQRAYEFVRPRTRTITPDGRLAYVFALKGSAGAGHVWPRTASVDNVAKVPVWVVKVDQAKELIYARLQKVIEPGAGYIHIPDAPEFGESWAKQLTAEKYVERTDRKGFPVRQWALKSTGRRNEALDCAVYSYSALCGLKAMGLDLDAEADAVARLIESGAVSGPAAPAATPPAPTPAAVPNTRARRRAERWIDERSDWLGGR